MTTIRAFCKTTAITLLGLGLMAVTQAAEYPSKPITIIVPYAPGGGGDAFTRAIALQAEKILDTKIFVENRMGGGATIGVGAVTRARPDGYTLGFISSSPIISVPYFFRVPYDPARDLVFLSRFIISAYPVLVRKDSPFQTFAELLDYGKANPGKLRWSTAGINGAPHIATEAALRKEGIKSAFIPMQGSTEVMAGLLGGTLQMGVVSDYAAPMAAGDVRALAEIGPDSVPELPGIPTFKELNYPLAPTIFYGMAGPAGLPQEVVDVWDSTLQTITASEEFARVAKRLNGNVAYLGHEAFEALVLEDIRSMGEALKDLGMGSPGRAAASKNR